MKLLSVQIKNFRSIGDLSLETLTLADNSFTYGLIGINEAGKSSILKAIAIKDGLIPLTAKDFGDKQTPVEILFNYQPTTEDIQVRNNEQTQVRNGASHDANIVTVLSTFANLVLKDDVSVSYSFTLPNLSTPAITILPSSDVQEILPIYKKHILDNVHRAIFWTAEDSYLISKPINLTNFAADPNLSIPLKNCFALANIDIKSSVSGLSDSTEKEHLEKQLGNKVTEHIKTVWPNHPIEITFDIDNLIINFHVKDFDAEGMKAKTADQRSDGFKQFISFLLTISAQNKNELLKNTILLLDEPETHLHPQAQEYLLDELIKITKNDRNNVVYFATHSNYMLDKNDLSRNYKIGKKGGKTIKERFNKSISTYASASYEVFNIPSTDYHNELYASLHAKFQDAKPDEKERELISSFDLYLNKEKKVPLDKPNTRNKKSKDATLPTYIRNCVHHPDNGYKFTKEELVSSIELLRTI
jgi:AAA15 family ATPase/GTPase